MPMNEKRPVFFRTAALPSIRTVSPSQNMIALAAACLGPYVGWQIVALLALSV
jgi:hypothetical protein